MNVASLKWSRQAFLDLNQILLLFPYMGAESTSLSSQTISVDK